jgi:hypothetical protein
MTDEQFAVSRRAFSKRRPFRHFFVEFVNDQKIHVRHPEGVGPFAGVWLFHEPNGDPVVFASTAVTRLLDVPQGGS